MSNSSIYCLFTIFILFTLISSNLSLYRDHVPCKGVGFCRCEFPNGLGIDLSMLRGQNLSTPLTKDTEVLFFPCRNVQFMNSTVTCSLCLKHSKTDQKNETYESIGAMHEAIFKWKSISDSAKLAFNHGLNNSHIQLECNAMSTTPLFKSSSPENELHIFTLTTEAACIKNVGPEGSSAFKTVIFVFLALFFIYFIGGFLFLRFVRGARGWESIPHGEFWMSLDKYLKAAYNRCRYRRGLSETYDTI